MRERAPWPTKFRTESGSIVSRPSDTRTWLRAAAKSGAVSARVPSRSNAIVLKSMRVIGRGALGACYGNGKISVRKSAPSQEHHDKPPPVRRRDPCRGQGNAHEVRRPQGPAPDCG